MRRVSYFLAALLTLVSAAASQVANPTLPVNALRQAAEDIAGGNLEKADAELQAILQSNPEEYRALNLLGIVRAQQHRNEEAEQIFHRVIAQAPQLASAHVNLGLLYQQTSRDSEALAQFQEALRMEPGRQDAIHAFTALSRSQARAVAASDPEKALATLLDARKLVPNDPEILYDFGMVALRMSLYKDAADAFRAALAIRADDPSSLYGLGRAQMGMAQFQDARDTFSHYLALRPNDASACYAYGITLAALQQSDAARRQFEQSLRLQPVQTESYYQLALLDLDDKNLDAAAGELDRVLSRDPHHAGALGAMGRLQYEKKNYDKAMDLLKQSISAVYDQRQAHYYLGLTLARLGQKDESEKELQLASDLDHAELEKQRSGVHILNNEAAH